MFKIKDAWQIVDDTQGVQIYTDTRDGQQYRYKQFGTQIWMIDNWNYGGLPGDYVKLKNSQSVSLGHAYRYEDADDYQDWESEYGLKRGAIYDSTTSYWGVPSGWHYATKSDWDTLIAWANTEFPGFGLQALMAKTTFWCPNNPLPSIIYDNYNKSGFSLVPGGQASPNSKTFRSSDKNNNCIAAFYTRTASGYRRFFTFRQNENSAISAQEEIFDSGSFWLASVRLVKDGGLPPAQPIITDIVTSLDSTGSDNKIATEKATRSAITSAVSSKMSNPMTAAGDLIVGGTSGAPSRLATGTQGQVLKVGASGLEWGNEAGGAVQSVSDTDSIGLTIDQNGDLTADLKIDSSSGNVSLTAGSDGLYGEVEFPVAALDSGSPGISVSGNVDNEYNIGLALSEEPDNIIQLKDTGNEGLYAPPSELDGLITTAGDLIVGGASGVPEALSAGAEGKVLKITSGVPAWGDDIGFANPMTNFGDIIFGGQVISGTATPLRLGPGTIGQVLGLEAIPTFGWKPAWVDPELPSIENYSLSLTDSVQESASENENKVHFSKVYCHTSKKVSRMGFFHKSGTQGVVGLGIYNASGSALVTTAVTGLTSATEGNVCWVDLLGPVTLTRGTVYWFAFFTGWASGEWNTNIQFARNTSINGVGNTMIITYSLGSGTTSMPSSITSTTEGQFVPWIVAD